MLVLTIEGEWTGFAEGGRVSGRKGECEVMEDVEVAQRMDVDGVKHQRDLQSNLLFLLCRV